MTATLPAMNHGDLTAAPAATMHIQTGLTAKTRVKAYRVADGPWPHVELIARVGDHTKIKIDLSPAEAAALAWGLLNAADGLA